MTTNCRVCGKRVSPIHIKTLFSKVMRQFVPAEDGDWPGEITVDHYLNIRKTVELYKIPYHTKGLVLKKRCPSSGTTFKVDSTRPFGKPYVVNRRQKTVRRRRVRRP